MRNEKALIKRMIRVILPLDDSNMPWFVIARDNTGLVVWLMSDWEGVGLKPIEVIGPDTYEKLIDMCRINIGGA